MGGAPTPKRDPIGFDPQPKPKWLGNPKNGIPKSSAANVVANPSAPHCEELKIATASPKPHISSAGTRLERRRFFVLLYFTTLGEVVNNCVLCSLLKNEQ